MDIKRVRASADCHRVEDMMFVNPQLLNIDRDDGHVVAFDIGPFLDGSDPT
jgi:hypothetical protein